MALPGWPTKCSGCQSSSKALRIASEENFGVAKTSSVSAPEAFSWIICESIDGSASS
jgi:hypothetical protein